MLQMLARLPGIVLLVPMLRRQLMYGIGRDRRRRESGQVFIVECVCAGVQPVAWPAPGAFSVVARTHFAKEIPTKSIGRVKRYSRRAGRGRPLKSKKEGGNLQTVFIAGGMDGLTVTHWRLLTRLGHIDSCVTWFALRDSSNRGQRPRLR